MGARTQTITDTDLCALRARNAQRAQAARERLGTAYLCHPSNRVKRLQECGPGILVVQRQLSFFGKQDGNEKETHPYPSKGGR